jgi:hypothetical protein
MTAAAAAATGTSQGHVRRGQLDGAAAAVAG